MELFTQFDTNNDGVLQENEFYAALDLLNLASLNTIMKSRIMSIVDRDCGHTISYTEFVDAFSVRDRTEASVLSDGKSTWQASVLQQVSNVLYQHRIHLKSAFRMFDLDHSGQISREEFKSGIMIFNSLLDSPITNEQIEELLKQLDKDNDGVLCYAEFMDGFQIVDVVPEEQGEGV